MPKDLDRPDQLTGADKVELAAEPTAKSVQKMIADSVKEALGPVAAEMITESRRVAQESAEKALKGKADEAAKADPENKYAQDFAQVWKQMLGQAQAKATETKSESKLRGLAIAMYHLKEAGGNPHIALNLMEKAKVAPQHMDVAAKALFGADASKHAGHVLTKAQGIHDFTSGGALLQGEMFSEVVPGLLSETAIVNDGAIMRVPVVGSLVVPYESSGPATAAAEENAATNSSEAAFEQLILTPKQRRALVPASKQMLRGVAQAVQIIEQSLRRSLAVDLDYQLIRGTGASSTQTGLRNLAQSANVLACDATVSVANTIIDLARLQQAVQVANVPWTVQGARYAFSPRTWRYLFTARDSDGYPFQQEMVTLGSVFGVKVAGQTGRGISAIPENLSVTGSNESEVYFYSTDTLLLAVDEDLRIEMGDGVAYNDSAGTVQSAFSRDQVVWKIVMGCDLGARCRGYEIAVLKDVDWGV